MDGVYVQGGINHSRSTQKSSDPNGNITNKGSGNSYVVTVGKDFGDYYAALNYSDSSKSKGSYTLGAGYDNDRVAVGAFYSLPIKGDASSYQLPSGNRQEAKGEFKSYGITASYTFPIASMPKLSPYVSATITRAENQTTYTMLTGPNAGRSSSNKYSYNRYGVGTGVEYQLTPKVRASAGIGYTKDEKVTIGNMTTNEHSTSIGASIRYTF